MNIFTVFYKVGQTGTKPKSTLICGWREYIVKRLRTYVEGVGSFLGYILDDSPRNCFGILAWQSSYVRDAC
jgi:hypothetical protein